MMILLLCDIYTYMRERNVLRGDKKLAGNVSVARAPRKKPNSNNIATTMFSGKKKSVASGRRKGKTGEKNDMQNGFWTARGQKTLIGRAVCPCRVADITRGRARRMSPPRPFNNAPATRQLPFRRCARARARKYKLGGKQATCARILLLLLLLCFMIVVVAYTSLRDRRNP